MKSTKFAASVFAVILIFFFVLLLSQLAQCQVDINIARPNAEYVVIARGAQWNTSGGIGDCSKQQCGVNNNFILPALYSQESVTVLIFNNSVATIQTGLVLTAAMTADGSVTQFQGNANKWSGSSVRFGFGIGGNALSLNLGGGNIQPGNMVETSFQVSGAARIVLSFSGGVTAGDTLGADIVIVQSQVFASPLPLISSLVGNGTNGLFPRATSSANLANANPVIVGCIAGTSSVLSANNTFLNCDTNGNLIISPNSTVNAIESSIDPCQSSAIAKSSTPINIASATTTLLVALSGTTKIFACHFDFTMVGAVQTLKFVYGTQTTTPCDTGQVALTGAYADGTASDIIVSAGSGSTLFATVAAQQLCAVTTGTVGAQGVLTFVQQ